MIPIYDTPNGLNYNSGILFYGGEKLTSLDGFMGLATGAGTFSDLIKQGFPLLADFSNSYRLTVQDKHDIDETIDNIIETLAVGSDYEKDGDNYILTPKIVIHPFFLYSDMFQDVVTIGYSQSSDPSGDINLAMTYPYQLAPDTWTLNLVKTYDKALNVVNFVTPSDLSALVVYSRYTTVGAFIDRQKIYPITLSDNNVQISIPKVAGELHKIEAVILIYDP